MCADGGANLLYESTVERVATDEETRRVPSEIVGDLDSVRQSVLDYYKALGTRITKDQSENSNDFHKALMVAKLLREEQVFPTIVIGGTGGRVDQTLGNLNTMYMEAEDGHEVFWLDAHNATLILPPGQHYISIDASREGPTCGLIPVGCPVDSVSTEGLRWNLDGQRLAFGKNGLVSTSNHITEATVHINTSHPLVWTVELHLS